MSKKMSRSEAGRLGGLRTAQVHGSEFFARIGRIGGSASSVAGRAYPRQSARVARQRRRVRTRTGL